MENKNQIEVGKKYFYKMKEGRGRPYVGEVLSTGLFVRVKNLNTGEVMKVVPRRIGRPYEFKPYQTKGRQAA